jgi:predicted amidohydrolase
MSNKVRFAGAQLPVTQNLEENKKSIMKAIDWASDNNCNWILTPEGSLSGYFPNFDLIPENGMADIAKATYDIVTYANKKNMGIALGTLWVDIEHRGTIRRNQIRYYDNQGELLGATNKQYIVGGEDSPHHSWDQVLADPPGTTKTHYLDGIRTTGMICNDLWGNGFRFNAPSLPLMASIHQVDLILHSTNGDRGNSQDSIWMEWHDIHLRMMSLQYNIPIITVDSCCDKFGENRQLPTSSPSGVVVNGEWVVQVPRTEQQHFYWDYFKPEGENLNT